MSTADLFSVVLPRHPYPGLRPFESDEWPIFFGRERMADEVMERIVRQQLVVVHGDSGCGKSSLLRAGVLPRLEQEQARGGLTWRTCTTLPREAPLKRLAQSISRLESGSDEGHEARTTEVRRILNFGHHAPRELGRLVRRSDDDQILIVVDQFEELFTFAALHGRDEARLYTEFLLGFLEQPPPGLHVVLTMRSEFLGACAQYPGLAQGVNGAQYLLPPMSRNDLLRAITEPALLYGGRVMLDLAERLMVDGGYTQNLPA